MASDASEQRLATARQDAAEDGDVLEIAAHGRQSRLLARALERDDAAFAVIRELSHRAGEQPLTRALVVHEAQPLCFEIAARSDDPACAVPELEPPRRGSQATSRAVPGGAPDRAL